MLAYTVISVIALVIMILAFLYIVIKFIDFPIDRVKKLFSKNKSDNNSQEDNASKEKSVKNKLENAHSKHRKRINYLRSFKKGKGLVFYFIAFPLFIIGNLYSGKGAIQTITTTISQVIDLLVLKYNFSSIEGLFNALPIYRVTICILYVLIFLNAIVFVLSMAHQLLCRTFYDFKFKMTKKVKVFLIGNNNQNKTIYNNAKIKEKLIKALVEEGKESKDKLIKREIRILDYLSKEDEKDLFLSNIRYKNIKNDNSYAESLFKEIANLKNYNTNGKQLYTIIINTGNAERNVNLTRWFVDKIEALDETSRRICHNILHIYVYSEPSHESIYEEFCKKTGACLTYFNKYKRIAFDFVSKYPFTMFMDSDEIDENTHLLKKDAEINAFLVGFGKTNQQIYISSVANNQYLTTDDNDMLVQKNVNYYIYDKANICEVKNLNHSFYRYKHESQEYNQEDYLELPKLSWNEYMQKCDINDPRFYSSLKEHLSSKNASINYVIIAFGSDLENIDMAHKILDLSYDWGIEDIWVFVKVRDSKNHTLINPDHCNISDTEKKTSAYKQKHCYFIGNEDETVYDLDQIVSDKYVDSGIYLNALYNITKNGIEKEKAYNLSKEEWLSKIEPMKRQQNIYSVLALRSRLNLIGFDYQEKANSENQKKTNGKDYQVEARLNDNDAKNEFNEVYFGKAGKPKEEHKDLYTIKTAKEMSVRDRFAALEHLRWTTLCIVHGMVPSTKDQIIREEESGKAYDRRRHGNITTMKGLIDFRKIVAEKTSKLESEADTIKYDYDALDNAVDLLDILGYEIVRKKSLKK